MVVRSAVKWWGVLVKRVVLGSFWVVSDGFCWLWVISDGFRWFAVLVVTWIHSIQMSYFFTILKNAHGWLRSLDFFIKSKTATKRLLLSCCLAVWKYVIISYTLLCCISNQKLILKENSHKTKSKWSIANYLVESVWKLLKNREIIRANGEMERIELKWGDLLVGWREMAGL